MLFLSKDYTFQKRRQLINSTNLNRLLRSSIYMYSDGQLQAAHLILRYTPMYWTFQNVGKAIKAGDPRLPFINVRVRGYVLSMIEIERSNSP